MSLSHYCYLIGLFALAWSGLSIARPAVAATLLRRLPRHKAAGYLLSTIAWLWTGYAVWSMGLDFLEPYKRYLPLVTIICIPLSWLWLDNLLPARSIGALCTLFPYALLHTARVHPSPWRLALIYPVYLLIIAGMTLLLYPWKLRQAIEWLGARRALALGLSWGCLAGGLGCLYLGHILK